MTLQIYDIARQRAGQGNLNWGTNTIVASIVSPTYTVNIPFHDFIGTVGGLLGTVSVINRLVDRAGWFVCDPIYFPNTPVGVECTQAVVWRQTDGLLLFYANFPKFLGGVNRPLVLIRGAASPGLCRL